MFTMAVMEARTSVSMIASRAPGAFSASRSDCRPSWNPRVITATVGRAIMRPRERSAVPRSPQPHRAPRTTTDVRGPAPGDTGGGTDGRSSVSVLNLPLCRSESLGKGTLRPEHRVGLQLVPTADVISREQIVDRFVETVVPGLRGLQIDRPLVVRKEELFCLARVEELHESLRDVLHA